MSQKFRKAPLLLLATGLSAAISAHAAPEYINGNMFIGPIAKDMVDGSAALVPGGAYWDADFAEKREIEETQLANGNCSTQWGRTWAGIVPYSAPFYPAQNATYWLYNIERDANGNLPAIRISGQYPHARYMSYNLYENATGYAASAVRDNNIQADEGSLNPFVAGTDRNVENRDYTLWYVSENNQESVAKLKSQYGDSNVIVIPNSVEQPGIALRVYLPDSGQDLYGGVGFPSINSFDPAATDIENAPTACPTAKNYGLPHMTQLIVAGEDVERLDPVTDAFRDVHFYFTPGGGTYPNEDARYGATLLTPGLNDDHEVTEFRFKAPTTTLTQNNTGAIFSADDEMRYWSLCMNGFKSTQMSRCINDEDVVTDEEGFVRVVISYNDLTLKRYIKKNLTGVNFMTYDGFNVPALILRHMVPNETFKTSFHNDADGVRPEGVHGTVDAETGEPVVANGIDTYWADKYIGDYSPVGKTCSIKDFKKNGGCI